MNKDAGRDHWARVQPPSSPAGMRVGQVIGSTDSTAAGAKETPIHYRDVLATIYHNLGIDPHGMVHDVSSRPNLVLPTETRPIDRLF
ncbi:MAG: DUF1501 domain-containing protein [Gemmataceae bacterium]